MKLTTVLGVTLLADAHDRPDRPESTATLTARKKVIPLSLDVRHAQLILQQPVGTLEKLSLSYATLAQACSATLALMLGMSLSLKVRNGCLSAGQGRLHSQHLLLCPGSLPGLTDNECHCVRRERLDSGGGAEWLRSGRISILRGLVGASPVRWCTPGPTGDSASIAKRSTWSVRLLIFSEACQEGRTSGCPLCRSQCGAEWIAHEHDVTDEHSDFWAPLSAPAA